MGQILMNDKVDEACSGVIVTWPVRIEEVDPVSLPPAANI